MRNQLPSSALRQTDSCVRGVALISPSRTPRQLEQPQFHWGNPPPAAEPNMRMIMSSQRRRVIAGRSMQRLAGVALEALGFP